MKESVAYTRLRPHLARLFAVDRVENAISPGMPDVLLSCQNRTLFVEMKAAVGKYLRGSQCSWCMRRHERGCRDDMFVLALDNYTWYVWWTVDVVNNAGLVSLDLDVLSFNRPENVVKFFHDLLFNPEGVEYDTRGRA